MTGIEKLRAYAEAYSTIKCAEILPRITGKCCGENNDCNACLKSTLDAIADQIERETFPRPMFDDGEPAQWGDEYEHNGEVGKVCHIDYTVYGWQVWSSGHPIVSSADGLKRPKRPKVFDADGVEINVGDEVWSTNDSGLVRHPFSFIVTEVEAHLVHGDGIGVLPCQVAHKRPEPPDTWERLTADIERCGDSCAYFGRNCDDGGSACKGCPCHGADDACMVLVMRDVLGRAKKLAGVE